MSEYPNYTLTQLAELILQYDHQEGLSPASLENLKEFAKSALENASQQPLAPDVCPVCRGKKGSRDAFDEWYPCQACDRTGKRR